MQHCDPEDLALLALGESPEDADVVPHLEHCEICQSEVRELSRVVQIGRSIEIDDQLVAPPVNVWTGITTALAEGAAADGETPKAASSNVVSLSSRKRRTWLPTAVAAALCLVLGGVVGGLFVKSNDDGQTQSPFVVASATLDPVPGGPDPQTTGAAKLERVDGQYVLRVDATGLRQPDGFYEVWMMDPENAGLVAIGTFNANQQSATFPVPEGLPMSSFNSVDISDEPFDGVPGHSKVSVLRGTLTA